MGLEPGARWGAALLHGEGPNAGFQGLYRQKNVPVLIISHSVISIKYDHFQDQWKPGPVETWQCIKEMCKEAS